MINSFVIKTLLGLHGFHVRESAAVDDGQIILPADRKSIHTQTQLIYDIYYKEKSFRRKIRFLC